MASELLIVLKALDQASKPIGGVGDALGSLEDRSKGLVDRGLSPLQNILGVGLKAAAGVAVAAFGGLTAAIGVSVGSAASMEQQVADIASVMGVAANEVGPLKDLIADLGMDPNLKVDATEAADAIQMLARNGLSMDEILGGAARSTVLLANATGADFGNAANIATDAMSLFNIATSDMERAVSGIASVTTSSKFSIDDYRLALAQAGGMAKTVGMPFDDFNAAIASIAPFFASGSDAGTGFKTFLQRLTPSTNEATEAMAKLGLLTENGTSAFFDATGSLKSMGEIIALLNRATANLSAEQRSQAFNTIFGSDAMRVAAAVSEQTQESFLALQKAMSQTDATDMAATRMDTLSGAMEILQGIISGIGLEIGDAFLPVFRKFVEAISDFLTEHAGKIVDWASSFAAWLQQLLEAWLPPVTKAIEGFFTALSQIGVVLGNLLSGDGSQLRTWLESLPEPWGTIGRAVIGVYDALRLMVGFMVDNVISPIAGWIGKFAELQDVLIGLGAVIAWAAGRSIVSAIGALIAAWGPLAAILAGAIGAVALIRNAWENDWWDIRERTRAALDYLNERFGLLLTGIKMFGGGALEEIWNFVRGNETSFANLKMIWEIAKVTAQSLFVDIKTFVQNNFPGWKNALSEWGKAAWQWIVDTIPTVLSKLLNLQLSIWKWEAGALATLISKLSGWTVALWNWIVKATPIALKTLGDWLGGMFKWLLEKAPEWDRAMGKFMVGAFEYVGKVVPNVIHKLGDLIVKAMKWSSTDAVDGFKKGLAALSSLSEKSGDDVTSSFLSAFGNILVAIIEVAIQIGTAFVFWLGQSILSLAGLDVDLWKFYDHIAKVTNGWRLGELAIGMWNKFVTALRGGLEKTISVFNQVWGWLVERIATGTATLAIDVFGWAANIANRIGQGLKSVSLLSFFSPLLETVRAKFFNFSETFYSQVWNPSVAMVQRIGQAIRAVNLQGYLSGVLDPLFTTFNGWTSAFSNHVWNPALGVVNRIGDALKSADLTTKFWNVLNPITNAFTTWAGQLNNAVWNPVQGIVNRIGAAFSANTFTATVYTALGNITNAFNGWVGGFLNHVWQPMQDIASRVINGFGSLDFFGLAWSKLNSIVDAFNGWVGGALNHFWATMQDTGKRIIDGLIDGLRQKWNDITSWFNNLSSAIPNWVRQALGIGSPSKVFAEIGKNIMQGLQEGVNAYVQLPEQALVGAAAGMAAVAESSATNVINNSRTNNINVTIPNTTGTGDPLSAARRYTNTLTRIYA